MKIILAGIILASLAFPAVAKADCNHASRDPISRISLNGHPFSAIASHDGCAIFVSLMGDQRSNLLVLQRNDGSVSKRHIIPVDGQLSGMALSPDGHYLAAANGDGVLIFDVARFEDANADPLIGAYSDGAHAGSIYAAFSPDQRTLFVANERSASLSVYDAGDLPKGLRLIGQVPVGQAPVGLSVTPNGRYLYSTSEVGPRSWATKCTSEGPPHPEGVLLIIDVAKAATDPAHSVLNGVAAGCNPVRVAISGDGKTLYVTARGDNAIQTFDIEKLLSDAAHSHLASVTVGTSPVGVIAVGERVIATNSNRFSGGSSQSFSVLSSTNLLSQPGSIPAGGFPRELNVTTDGNTLLVTNFSSGDLELIDLRRLEQAEK